MPTSSTIAPALEALSDLHHMLARHDAERRKLIDSARQAGASDAQIRQVLSPNGSSPLHVAESDAEQTSPWWL